MVMREGGPDDADLVARLHQATAEVAYANLFPGQPYPVETTRQRWRSFEGRLLIAEVEGRPAGFVAFAGDELHALYVLPEHWGKGIGSRLLERAGPVRRLWVLEANRQARSFYEARGWRPDGASQAPWGVREVRLVKTEDCDRL